MTPANSAQLDFIEELKLRRWARLNYVAPVDRDDSWHPVVHDEMRNADRDMMRRGTEERAALTYVPLLPSVMRLDTNHSDRLRSGGEPAASPVEMQF